MDTVFGMLAQQRPSGGFDWGQGQRAVYLTSAVVSCFAWLRDNGGKAYEGKLDKINNSLGHALVHLPAVVVALEDGNGVFPQRIVLIQPIGGGGVEGKYGSGEVGGGLLAGSKVFDAVAPAAVIVVVVFSSRPCSGCWGCRSALV